MIDLQDKNYLVLLRKLKNINSYKAVHFIDIENMVGNQKFKSNPIKRYVSSMNNFLDDYLDIYDDKNSLFIISANSSFIGSSFYKYKNADENNILSYPSLGKDGADLVLVDSIKEYLISNESEPFLGRVYIASSDKKFSSSIVSIQEKYKNFYLIITTKGNTGFKMLQVANFLKVFGLQFPEDLLFFIKNWGEITGSFRENNNFIVQINNIDSINFNDNNLDLDVSIYLKDEDNKYLHRFTGENNLKTKTLINLVKKYFGVNIHIYFNDSPLLEKN